MKPCISRINQHNFNNQLINKQKKGLNSTFMLFHCQQPAMRAAFFLLEPKWLTQLWPSVLVLLETTVKKGSQAKLERCLQLSTQSWTPQLKIHHRKSTDNWYTITFEVFKWEWILPKKKEEKSGKCTAHHWPVAKSMRQIYDECLF